MRWLIAKTKTERADAKARGCIDSYEFGYQVSLNTKTLPTNVVSDVFKTKLRPRFIEPLTVIEKKGLAYTLNLQRKLCTQPMFYVGLLKPYHDSSLVDRKELSFEGGKSYPLNASSSRAPLGHTVEAG